MKIGIVSDFHIGYERFYDDAYTQAREAIIGASERSDMLVIPGDIFDKRYPKPDVLAQAINLFRDIKNRNWTAKVTGYKPYGNTKIYTDIPVIAIPGTHERTAEGKENPLTLLSLAGLLVDCSESTVTVSKGNEHVSVFAIGGLSEELVKPRLNALNPKPILGSFNIFMFHQSTYELLPFSDHFIHNDELPKGFDLYINGHIHNKVIDKIHGNDFLIPGSTVLTQLKSGEQEDKGFFIYDTITRTFEFFKINSRPFIASEITIHNATPQSFKELIEKKINSQMAFANSKKPIIKIIIFGTIGNGFSKLDMPIRSIEEQYKDSIYLDFDVKNFVDPKIDKQISDIQEGKIMGNSIKEYGFALFSEKLKKLGFNADINISELFNALIISKKEKAVKEAIEILI